MRIAIAADTHIGANKFGTTDGKWNAPVTELVEYAIENKLDAVAIAGDVFHHRRPTPASQQFMYDAIKELKENDIAFFGADGNHDDGVAIDSTSATWAFMEATLWVRKRVLSWDTGKLNITLLPWPTPQAYGIDNSLPLKEQLEATQAAVLDELKQSVKLGKQNILIGHAMVAYGSGESDLAPSPGLQWAGKDVVFDYATLTKGFETGVYLGHVHDPESKGYVGSTQPTDWGDAPQFKSFKVLDTETMVEETVYYRTSLKLLDMQNGKSTSGMGFHSSMGGALDFHYDIGRYSQHVGPGEEEPTVEELAVIRAKMEAVCDVVHSIEITKDRTVVQRVREDIELATMQPMEAIDVWLKQSSVDPKTSNGVRSKFKTLIEASSES